MTFDPTQDALNVGIVGAGIMGRGIAQVAATGGCRVTLFDTRHESSEEAVSFIGDMLRRAVAKGRMEAAQADGALARIQIAESIAALGECPVVVEAASEDLKLKRHIFAELEEVVDEDAVLASNTSSLSITTIAAACKRPERVAGLHFFNPVPLMKLVEVIDGVRTAPWVAGRLVTLGERMGRTPIRVADAPGFLVNQVGRGLTIEAAHLYSERVAGFADVDRIMRDSGGFRMGPFELMDLTAIDVTHPATELIYEQFYHEPRYRPSTMMKARMQGGLLGRKTGRGFYEYSDGGQRLAPEPEPPPFDGRPVWVSGAEAQAAQRVVALLESLGVSLDAGAKPASESLILVAPLGKDATTAAVDEGLDARRTVAVDTLFGLERRRTLMRTPITDPDFVAAARGLLGGDGTPVSVINDSPGFVAQRITAMIVNIGCAIAQSGVATPADIDRAVTLGLGYPYGPLAFGDALGADCILRILQGMHGITGDPRYRPTPWLRRRAALGVSLLTPDP
jgi:3-hydroxybutyryl-CoA dehydrogenase